jgi:tetratricopeptide (TPR) repeat protein
MHRTIIRTLSSQKLLRNAWRAAAAIAGLSLWYMAQPASAQVTTQMLIGDAVSEVGNRYPDVDKAIERFTNRDFLGARLLLEDAKRKDPSLPPSDLILAKLYFLSGNEVAGRNALEKTVADNPTDPEVFLILADQAIRQGRTIEAEALYDKAMQLTEKFSENARRKRNFDIRARTGRAVVAERRKNWPAAIADLRALIKTDPENAMAHYRLGAALFMQAKAGPEFKAGYDEFVAAKKWDKNKELPNPFVSAALMYDQLDKRNEAQRMFDEAVKAEPNNASTLASYAQWLIKTGQVEKAEAVLAGARKSNPQSLDVWILSGVAARMLKKAKPAEDYFMEALRISPSNVAVFNQLALLLIEQADKEKQERALQFAGINAKLNTESAEAQITLAWVLYQFGRLAEADTAFQNGVRLGNFTPDSSYVMARMLVDQKRADMAKTLLTSALDSDSTGIFVNRKDAQALLNSLGSQ